MPVWLLMLQPICLDGTRPVYKVIFPFHFTSHPAMPANFGHSAQYLSCPHFGMKPHWVRNTASVLCWICWHLCGSDHLNSGGRKLELSALETAKYTCCCEARGMLRRSVTHHSMPVLIANTLQSQDHHKQKDKDSKTKDTSHRHRRYKQVNALRSTLL